MSLPRATRRAAALEIALCLLVLLAGLALRERIGRDWSFTGADSYQYMGAAIELSERHRYAFPMPAWYPDRPPEEKVLPGTCRMPGYPLFLAGLVRPPVPGYEAFYPPAKRAQWVVDVLTCLLVFLIARALGGRLAAWPAFLAAIGHPFLVLFASALLSETLATFLTTLALGLVLWAMRRPGPGAGDRPLIAAGAVVALGTLMRQDGILLLLCLPLPILLRRPGVRRRALVLSLLAFTLVMAPWTVRNLLRFGEPRVLGWPCDTRGRPLDHSGFFRWFATWVVREDQTPATLYCFFRDECRASVDTYPPEAFDSAAEREELARLFALRQREGLSAQVDAGFQALAGQRLRRHPVRSLVLLPLRRAYHLWIGPHDQPLRASRALPWPAVTARLRPYFRDLSALTVALGIIGLLALLRGAGGRQAALLFALALGARTGFLAVIGFVDNRYVLEVTPLMLVLLGVALGQGGRAVHLMAARRRPAPAPR